MLIRSLLVGGAAGLVLAAPATAAPTARTYKVSLSGTQESSWAFTETGTCTGDDFSEHPFSGEGAGTSVVSFKAPPTKLVVSRIVNTRRWAFAYQPYDVKFDGRRAGTHSQTCPNSESQTFTSPTDDCGTRSGKGAAKAILNLPAARKPGFMDFTATGGPSWGECPYFFGLDPSGVSDELDLGFDFPSATLLAVRKSVGGKAFRRGKPVTISARRTKPYRTTEDTGDTTRTTTGETTIALKLVMTPVRRR